MTGAALLLLALALVAAFGDWVAVARERKALEYLCKPLTLGLLTASAVAFDPDQSAVRTWFVVALGLCLLGDIFLMLPQDVFVPGLAAFLLGHIAYVGGMFADGIGGEPVRDRRGRRDVRHRDHRARDRPRGAGRSRAASSPDRWSPTCW